MHNLEDFRSHSDGSVNSASQPPFNAGDGQYVTTPLIGSGEDAWQPHSSFTTDAVRPLKKYSIFSGLLITTTVSCILLIGNEKKWTLPDRSYSIITRNRALTQVVVQIISNILGIIYVSVICALFNYATRLWMRRSAFSLDIIRWWSDLCSLRFSWDQPMKLLIPLLVFNTLAAGPSALWTGALTPVDTYKTRSSSLMAPRYANISLVHEYPSEIEKQGPKLRNSLGLFAYSVGMQFQGSLITSASSASPVDGQPRQHGKLDYTGFTFFGRSYGIGASVGIKDKNATKNELAIGYQFQEPGYETIVTCIYNSSSKFAISPVPVLDQRVWEVGGYLPNSGDVRESSEYFGHSTERIVAIGVASNSNGTITDKYLGIAAGRRYKYLDNVQCQFLFVPTLFNVSVGLTSRNITVTPVGPAEDIDSTGQLTFALTRQYELISNDQTNLYSSLLGDSFNASISDYHTSISNLTNLPNKNQMVLTGIENSITAMADDMLLAYSSAQLMIAKDSRSVPAIAQLKALKIGQQDFIYAIFAGNIFILLLVAVEASRTRGWRELISFDYIDPRKLIIAGSMGGPDIAKEAVSLLETRNKGSRGRVWGKLRVMLSGKQYLAIRLREGGTGIVSHSEESIEVADGVRRMSEPETKESFN